MLFSKYVALGNDFILFDNREFLFPTNDPLIIPKLCHRQFGIGADGIILLEDSKTADYKMRIFNSDGSEAEMCGNGIRCLFKFIQECNGPADSYLIETKASIISMQQDKTSPDQIVVSMQDPTDISWNIDLILDQEKLKVHYLNTGVPHAVIFSPEIKDLDLKEKAPKIRFHECFLPKGTNVNFASVTGKNSLTIRTYERGVENETLGCGTGVTATALAAAYLYKLELPIQVKTKSEELLNINCTINDSTIKNVTMTGKADFVYRGQLH